MLRKFLSIGYNAFIFAGTYLEGKSLERSATKTSDLDTTDGEGSLGKRRIGNPPLKAKVRRTPKSPTSSSSESGGSICSDDVISDSDLEGKCSHTY